MGSNVVGNLIIRGLLVGIVAGLLAFGWAKVFGEPQVDTAISYESAKATAAGEPDEPEIVSRAMQSTFGLMTGTVVIGAGIGALFSILFAFANGRLGKLGPQQTSLLLALLCFLAVFFVPFLKYPANPPAVGEPETIQFRDATFFLMMAISVAAMGGLLWLRSRLAPQYGTWYATLMSVAAYLVVVGAVYLILPNVNEVPDDFSAVTLYNFRLTTIGLWTILWIGTGLIFGFVVERTMEGMGSSVPAVRRSAMMMR